MSNIKPTKAQMFNGLRRRPKYEEISNEINPDKTKIIYPDRDAKFLREDPRMTQLDGLGFFESMQEQQESINKEQRKETIIQEIARDTGTGAKEVKAKDPPKRPEMFKMDYEEGDYGDDDDAPMPGHQQAIEEATETSKQTKMTKTQQAILKAKLRLGRIKSKTNELVDKNNPEVPDEIKENEPDKTNPPPKMGKVKMDEGITKKTKAKKQNKKSKKKRLRNK